MGPDHTFVKGLEWEVREFPSGTERADHARGAVRGAEVARDADEFAHWSHTAFEDSTRAPRKRRE